MAKMRLLNLIFTLTTFLALTNTSAGISPALQNVLNNAYKRPLYNYPTSLTQGIIPVSIHSHNDYWRPIPFYSALSVGAISVEADVWLYNGTLHVGHEESALTAERSFENLYINPILDGLKKQNPNSSFLNEGPTHNGVYDTDNKQTLYLFIDVKTDGPTTWPSVLKVLQPLYTGGWLTTVNTTNQLTSRPITVIGTGNTPLSQIQSQVPRYTFFDGPIPTLNTSFSNLTSQISPIASTDFTSNFGTVLGTRLNETQLELLRDQVKVAHAKGIKLRYWNQPPWPISTRNGLWRQLRDEGVDLINVDDLEAGAGLGEMEGYW